MNININLFVLLLFKRQLLFHSVIPEQKALSHSRRRKRRYFFEIVTDVSVGGASLCPVCCCLWSRGDKHAPSQRTSVRFKGLFWSFLKIVFRVAQSLAANRHYFCGDPPALPVQDYRITPPPPPEPGELFCSCRFHSNQRINSSRIDTPSR